jgi:Domain of Unknown Function with PDB structure (DUF3857)
VPTAQLARTASFTLSLHAPKLSSVPLSLHHLSPAALLLHLFATFSLAQQPPLRPPADDSQLPFQIQLLETNIRVETSGDSLKQVHTIVRINNLLGAREFSHLKFEYNRTFQQVDIPLVRVSHASGGTSELLPSAISDAPSEIVADFPAYQDVRVKSVRILGLQEGDIIEYRVKTASTSRLPAPGFWLQHTFDRSGQVLEERYELDLPRGENFQARIDRETPPGKDDPSSTPDPARLHYAWQRKFSGSLPSSDALKSTPDVEITTCKNWFDLAMLLAPHFEPSYFSSSESVAKAKSLAAADSSREKLEALYDFVSQKITTVELPPGATSFQLRKPDEILKSGYATPEDKYQLLAALGSVNGIVIFPVFLNPALDLESSTPNPDSLTKIVVVAQIENKQIWMDPTSGITPFAVLPANLRGLRGLRPGAFDTKSMYWNSSPQDLPFAAFQKVNVDADLSADGTLSAKVSYILRGDNELLLRLAFHQTPKDKWRDVAGLLAISDGFRGQVTSVTASDPAATKDPFRVDYAISQPKFVDWTKKPVRIPALLPQIGLPDPPPHPAAGSAIRSIELGTPLDVETKVTLKLPIGTTAAIPAATSVKRDYASFASNYAAKSATITAARHINFLAREIPADRAMDYNAFLHAVQNDQLQTFTLTRAAASIPARPARKPEAKK